VEDATHVWQCQDPRAVNVWTQAIANLEVWLQKQRTQPGMLYAKLLACDLQIEHITAEFDMGPSGLAPAAQVHFLRGLLPSLLQQQPAYQTAWLIRIQAARARAERRDGQRQQQQRDTFNSERQRLQRWLRTTNN
jgi:hypothetical protein